jgi:uncharacterized protein (TIGR03086 family)
MDAALAEPGALDGNAVLPGLGSMPKQQVIGIAAGDMLIHSWDLARALGRDDTLPSEAVEAVYAALQSIPSDFLRAAGRFKDPVEVPDDASTQDKLLAYAGRQP